VRNWLKTVPTVVIIGLASLALGACSSGGNGKTVDVALGDFSMKPAVATVAAGDIKFKVHNGGGFEHEMVVFKVADASRIPSKANGEADEEAVPESAHMGEVEHVAPGATKTLKLTLGAGKYVLFCNLIDGAKAHFKEGMHAEFTVTG
jgi:uncharacterized cupredoxin-like copper-binding protein